MKRSSAVIVAIIIVIVLIVGGFFLFHKPNKTGSVAHTTPKTTTSTAAPVNNSVLTTKTDSSLGQYLADPSGKPLYTYNADTNGASNCTGSCLANWPAYTAQGSTDNLPAGVGTITRSDNGQTQYTYNGMPLYYFTGDSNGRVTGDGVEDFSVAKPAGSSSNSSNRSGTQPPSGSTDSSQSGGGSYDYSY